MKCEECLQLLDLYFDGELSGGDAASVAAHLGGCAACSGEYRRLGDEQELYLLYECDAAESPAFWDGVLSKAREEKSTRADGFAARLRGRISTALSALSVPRFSPTVTAAMLLTAVGLTAAVMSYYAPREELSGQSAGNPRASDSAAPPSRAVVGATPGETTSPATVLPERGSAVGEASPHETRGRGVKMSPSVVEPPKRARRPTDPARQGAAPDELVRQAEGKYLAAIAILSRDAGRRRTRMAPEALARFDRTLAVIDRAIAETRSAAREHPRDPVAVHYMLAAYAKKVEVLREMAQN